MTQAINIENLSKKYIIGHQTHEKYLTLRDSLANIAKKIFNKNYSDPSVEEFWALKDISIQINEGDKVGIIGRNGAGKSTLLKILSKITEPTSGKIQIKGRISSLLEVGTGFHPELTGRENIFLNGAVLGMAKKEIKRKFDEIVNFADIEKFLDTPVKRYSSGMYVRLAFAIAAHLEPEILIVDEVLAVGDSRFQQKCLGKMNDIGSEGRTVIFVSHNMAIISALCNKGLLLENGQTKYFGDINQAVSLYSSDIIPNSRNIPLLKRKRTRKCPMYARIEDIAVITDNGVNSEFLDSSKPFKIRATILSDIDTAKNDMGVVFYIKDSLQTLTYLYSHCVGIEYSFKKGRNIVECEVEPPMLTAGDYRIGFGLHSMIQGEVIDEVDDVFSFTIPFFDPYGNGKNLKSDGLKYVVGHKWSEVVYKEGTILA